VNDVELAGIGRQFVILCAERENLVRGYQELQIRFNAVSKELEDLKKNPQPMENPHREE